MNPLTTDEKAQALRHSQTFNSHPDQVTSALFSTHDFFDARDALQVKYEMLRCVQLDGWTPTQAAKAFGCSRPTFYAAQRAFSTEGIAGLTPQKRGPKAAYKFTAEAVAFLRALHTATPTLRAPALAACLAEHFGISAHPRSIERALSAEKKRLAR